MRKKVSRPLCCDDGGPLGRPLSLLRAYGGLTGTRLGTVLGSRRGRPSIANTKNDDFWQITEKSPQIAAFRAVRFWRNIKPLLRFHFWGSKKGPRRGSYSGMRGATNRARAPFWGRILMRNPKNDDFGDTKNTENNLHRLYLGVRKSPFFPEASSPRF